MEAVACYNRLRITDSQLMPRKGITMGKNEKSGKDVGSLASKALRDPGSVTKSQIKSIAASALTQRPDHRPSSKPAPKRR
jgi:hypothetical protein